MTSTPTEAFPSQQLGYHCQPCGIDMFIANVAAHLAGKKHRKRCAVLGVTEGGHDTASPSLVIRSGPGYCGFCKEHMVDGVEKHMAAGMPHWNAVQRAKSAIGEHPPATPESAHPIMVHPLGIVERCLAAPEPAAEEKRCTVAADEPNRGRLPSSPTLRTSVIEVRSARQATSETTDMTVWESSGSREIQRLTGGGGTDPSRDGRLIEGSSKADEASIAAHRAEHAREIGLERQAMPQPDLPGPLSAFTLQSESSTARIYCDSCVRQLNTPTGFVAHMKGKTHKRIMEAKISASQAAEDVHVVAIMAEKSTIPALPANRWYCSSCHQDMSVDSRDEHLASLLHALSRGEIPTFDSGRQVVLTPPVARAATAQILVMQNHPPVLAPLVIPSDSFYCAPCKRTRKLVGYDGHMHSESHCTAAQLLGPLSTALENSTSTPVSASDCNPETWFCITCKVYLNSDVRESHRSSKQHIIKSGKQPYLSLGIRDWSTIQQLDTFWPSPVGDDEQPENVSSDQATAKNIAGDEPRKMVVRDVNDETMEDDSDNAPGGIELEGAGVEAHSSDAGVFSRLDELVHRRAQEMKNAQPNVPAETEPEMWNCSLCEMDITTAMRQVHESHPFHVHKLEMKKEEVDGLTKPQARGPTNHRDALFRCLVCLTTYDASGRHLHATAPWHCEACDIIVHTSGKSDHLLSVSHRLKESAPGTSSAEPAFTPASKDTFFCLPCRRNIPKSDRKLHISPSCYCPLCELVMHADTRDIHEWSLKHSRAVAAATARPVKREVVFNCQTCKTSFPIAVQPFHKSRAWTCELCDSTVHMDWIGAHLVSAEHVAREKDLEEQADMEEDGDRVGLVTDV